METLDLPQDLIWASATTTAQVHAWDAKHEEMLIFEDSFVNGTTRSSLSLRPNCEKTNEIYTKLSDSPLFYRNRS